MHGRDDGIRDVCCNAEVCLCGSFARLNHNLGIEGRGAPNETVKHYEDVFFIYNLPVYAHIFSKILDLGADYMIPLTRDYVKRNMILRY